VKRWTAICLLSCLAAMPVAAALKDGDEAPDFSLPASLAGKTFTYSLPAHLMKGPVVVYFYPAAYTGGCNLQAHTFAQKSDEFASAGASIVGVSLDSIDRLNQFSEDPDFCAGKFPTASDETGAIGRAYDLSVREAQAGKKDTRGVEINHGFVERTTFIVTPDGRIAAAIGGLAPMENVAMALEVVRHLNFR
jgi:peroxiredoxin Q/BCP